MRLIKVLRETESGEKFHVQRLSFIGLDLVYGASGLLVMVLANISGADNIGLVVVIYVALLLIAFIAEIVQEKFGDFGAMFVHLFLISLVIASTLMTSMVILYKPTHNYQVVIPYKDKSLFGDKIKEEKWSSTNLMFVCNLEKVESESETDIKDRAIDEFWKKITPLIEERNAPISKKIKGKTVHIFKPLKKKDIKEILICNKNDIIIKRF